MVARMRPDIVSETEILKERLEIAEARAARLLEMVKRLATTKAHALGGFMTMGDQETLREAASLVAELG